MECAQTMLKMAAARLRPARPEEGVEIHFGDVMWFGQNAFENCFLVHLCAHMTHQSHLALRATCKAARKDATLGAMRPRLAVHLQHNSEMIDKLVHSGALPPRTIFGLDDTKVFEDATFGTISKSAGWSSFEPWLRSGCPLKSTKTLTVQSNLLKDAVSSCFLSSMFGTNLIRVDGVPIIYTKCKTDRKLLVNACAWLHPIVALNEVRDRWRRIKCMDTRELVSRCREKQLTRTVAGDTLTEEVNRMLKAVSMVIYRIMLHLVRVVVLAGSDLEREFVLRTFKGEVDRWNSASQDLKNVVEKLICRSSCTAEIRWPTNNSMLKQWAFEMLHVPACQVRGFVEVSAKSNGYKWTPVALMEGMANYAAQNVQTRPTRCLLSPISLRLRPEDVCYSDAIRVYRGDQENGLTFADGTYFASLLNPLSHVCTYGQSRPSNSVICEREQCQQRFVFDKVSSAKFGCHDGKMDLESKSAQNDHPGVVPLNTRDAVFRVRVAHEKRVPSSFVDPVVTTVPFLVKRDVSIDNIFPNASSAGERSTARMPRHRQLKVFLKNSRNIG
jgi:hypothetical protein